MVETNLNTPQGEESDTSQTENQRKIETGVGEMCNPGWSSVPSLLSSFSFELRHVQEWGEE